ncbi:hypothetical protein ACMFMF_007151 [Clarireedia jacksonii]
MPSTNGIQLRSCHRTSMLRSWKRKIKLVTMDATQFKNICKQCFDGPIKDQIKVIDGYIQCGKKLQDAIVANVEARSKKTQLKAQYDQVKQTMDLTLVGGNSINPNLQASYSF